MPKSEAGTVTSQLPNSFGSTMNSGRAINCIKEILNEELPQSDRATIETELKWNFLLDKQPKASKQKRWRKQGLTRKEREKLDLLRLPRSGWKRENVLAMNHMWKDYMRENLEHAERLPSCSDVDYASLVTVLSKSEFIGAEITIVRSTVPTYVGLKGIVVLETKATFQIVTADNKLKLISKQASVFAIVLDNMKFTIFGKSLMARPSERSVKKLKSYVTPDL